MFSDNTHNKLIELRGLLNLSSSDFTELYNLMKDAYRDGFDYGCVRSREEMVPLGTLADMTVQQLANLIGMTLEKPAQTPSTGAPDAL
jgi:hypothetical protein